MSSLSNVATYLARKINRSKKTQKQIAREAGFPAPNVLSMIKSGETKLPLPRVPALAKSLEIDAGELLRLCLAEYEPEVFAVLERVRPISVISDAEIDLIRAVRYLRSVPVPSSGIR